jgi:hypothetical protein
MGVESIGQVQVRSGVKVVAGVSSGMREIEVVVVAETTGRAALRVLEVDRPTPSIPSSSVLTETSHAGPGVEVVKMGGDSVTSSELKIKFEFRYISKNKSDIFQTQSIICKHNQSNSVKSNIKN